MLNQHWSRAACVLLAGLAGPALELTAKGTKYYRDDPLN